VSPLPSPAQARALIVGLEKYNLTDSDLDGAAADALRMADLLERFGMPPANIELWLAPKGKVGTKRPWKAFTGAAFEQRLTTGLQNDKTGGLLFIYWSGHGVVAFSEHSQYLLFPEAEKDQLRSFRFDNISNLLLDRLHAQFGHQVLVIDACRSPLTQWGVSGLAEKPMQVAPVDAGRVVEQCQLFACSLGQAGAQMSEKGSSLMQQIETEWKNAPKGVWPDFETSFRRIQERVEQATNGQQIPATASFVRGWNGARLAESASLTEPSLYSLIQGLEWPPGQGYLLHAIRSLRSSSPHRAMNDLREAIQHLGDLPETGDVPPLAEFATRVAQSLGDNAPAALRKWLLQHITPLQRTAILERIGEPRSAYVLQLWHDTAPPRLRAALFDGNNRLLEGWDRELDRLAGRPLAEAIGATLEAARNLVGDELTLELCLPSELLAHGLDLEQVPMAGEKARLGKDYAVILRCTDRSKSPTKRKAWLAVAVKILDRIGRSKELVRWAGTGAGSGALLKGFFDEDGGQPIWIGILDSPTASTDHERVLETCLVEGLPALLWMRPRLDEKKRKSVEKRLARLLGMAAQDLPGGLLLWRRGEGGQPTEGTALLLDDPRRLPPWPVQLGAGGQTKGPT